MQELITHQQVFVEPLLWHFNYLIWIYLDVLLKLMKIPIMAPESGIEP